MNATSTSEVKRDDKPVMVPYLIYRDSVMDNRWVVKRLTIALIIAVCLLFASNIAWLIVWNSYDYSSTETIVDSSENGIANYTGGNGGIMYGPDNNSENDPNATQWDEGNTNP